MDFRFPHSAENIGAAVRDAVNPETSEDGSLVIQLMNENNRAVEDAFQDSGYTPPSPPDQTIYSTQTTIDTFDTFEWSDPPTGNLWRVMVIGNWVDIASTGPFSSKISANPTGLSLSQDSKLLTSSAPGWRNHAWTFDTFGPVIIGASSSEIVSGDTAPGGSLEVTIEAVWVRAELPSDA